MGNSTLEGPNVWFFPRRSSPFMNDDMFLNSLNRPLASIRLDHQNPVIPEVPVISIAHDPV